MSIIKDEQAKFDAFIQSHDELPGIVSGSGSESRLPEELRGFNWGGLMMNFVWGLAMHIPWTWLHLVPVVGWVMPLVMWVRGNEWAWRYRHWDSVEHFRRVQRNWEIAGVIFVILNLIVAILLAASLERYLSQMMSAFNT